MKRIGIIGSIFALGSIQLINSSATIQDNFQ